MSNQFDDFFSTVVFQKQATASVDYPQGIPCMELDDTIPFDHYANGAQYGQLLHRRGLRGAWCKTDDSDCLIFQKVRRGFAVIVGGTQTCKR